MLIFQFHHYIKPEYIEAYKTAIIENVRTSMSTEPGFLRFDILQDQADPAHFSLYEIYRDAKAREAHLESAHFLIWKELVLGQEMFAQKGHGGEFDPVVISHLDEETTL